MKLHPYIKSVTQQIKLIRNLKQYENDEYINKNSEESQIRENTIKKRLINRVIPKSKSIVEALEAQLIWNMGFTGRDVNIAIFDTGLEENHPHFKNIVKRIDWTTESNPNDLVGHGI